MKNQQLLTWSVVGLFVALALVAACSSDSGNGGSQGTFNDGPVEGLGYEVDGQSGTTGPGGEFDYRSSSDQITFSVGDIVLGTATVKSFMTPVDLVADAVDETNNTVTNIARFLQTLDGDANLSNGIQIPAEATEAAAGRSMNFAQTPEAFENDPNVQEVLAALTTNPLVSAEDAQRELRNTILARLAGNYGGSFSGDGSGCWSFQVDGTGAVTGTFDIEEPQNLMVTLPLMGMIPSSGAFTLTGSMEPALMITIAGTVTTDGEVINGSWTLFSNESQVASGSFTGGEDQACQGDGNGGNGGNGECPNNAVKFVFTPLDGPQFTVDTCASFDCQDSINGCALQVFDIEGEDRFLQFLTTDAPFMVNNNICFGFDFVVDEPGGTGRGLANGLSNLTGRQFGDLDPDNPTPFATGDYAYRNGGGETLGTFEFFEDGFVGFQIPTQSCGFSD